MLLSSLRPLAVAIALAGAPLAACSVAEDRQSAGAYVDDATVSTRVRTAIVRDPDLSLSQLNVETFNGEVQLSGFTDSQAKANKAASLARETPGVKNVRNNIVVRP